MIRILDLFGLTVFAVTGALAAGRKRMDIFGVVVVALVTALGGGTIRDVVLGRQPVFWVGDPGYVIVAVVAALITFFAVRFIPLPTRLLLFFDAFGLAFFTVTGCQRALQSTDSAVIVTVMGIMTGTAGGMVRDILCGEIPVILRREIYATASLLGCAAYLLLIPRTTPAVAAAVAMGIILVIRLAALRWRIGLPVFDAGRAEP